MLKTEVMRKGQNSIVFSYKPGDKSVCFREGKTQTIKKQQRSKKMILKQQTNTWRIGFISVSSQCRESMFLFSSCSFFILILSLSFTI